ncbi:lysozyme inhibitor LprI family protein [Yoonia vestfoldensis]|uniref:lysozyme inhibitor LprI family protein n=1 Tax=Yoonia vestfoldensis TaxID=245188 RepID=UPI00037ACF10|nr:lysozyme inhibitor LprI family protein [Yoonia vestfoldensis]
MKIATLALILLPCAAIAQDDWLYAPMVAACLSSGDAACIGDAASMCMADERDGDTTVGMSGCLAGEAGAWDALLNAEYAAARDFARAMDAEEAEFFPEYAVRADQVQVAQRAWIAFRDANCAMQYGVWEAGSMRQIAGADCLLEMTAAQTFALRDYHNVP